MNITFKGGPLHGRSTDFDWRTPTGYFDVPMLQEERGVYGTKIARYNLPDENGVATWPEEKQ